MITIEDLKRRFEYQPDKFDNWRVMDESGPLRGDCDDFAVTALYACVRCSMFKFWLALFTGKGQLWLCKTDAGQGHMMLKFEDRWIDNIYPMWSTVPKHKKVFPYWGPLAVVKMALSRIVRFFY